MHSKRSGLVTLTVVFLVGLALGNVMQRLDAARAQTNRVYELRTYVSQPGRLDNVLARFRDHAAPILERHGIRSVGYWVPVDARAPARMPGAPGVRGHADLHPGPRRRGRSRE